MTSLQFKLFWFAFLTIFGQSNAFVAPGSGIASVEEIATYFNALDIDGDGKLTRDQLNQLMISIDKDLFLTYYLASNSDVSDDTMMNLAMAMADSDEDNMVSLDEINNAVARTSSKQEATDATTAAFLKVFDR